MSEKRHKNGPKMQNFAPLGDHLFDATLRPTSKSREPAPFGRLLAALARGPPGFLDGAWCSIEKEVRNCNF